jgi:ankyrin repeat protein
LVAVSIVTSSSLNAQVAPSVTEVTSYTGLHAAASNGNTEQISQLVAQGADLEAIDSSGRTAVHVAAFASNEDVLKALFEAGANINALENSKYDVITIAAVENDLDMLRMALSVGGNPSNITSLYEGTALIAAAHLGHFEVVTILIEAGAPLDHINNLGWTALIESIVLGDGGPRHIDIARALIEAGADVSIADRQGVSPYSLAKQRGYHDMVALFR